MGGNTVFYNYVKTRVVFLQYISLYAVIHLSHLQTYFRLQIMAIKLSTSIVCTRLVKLGQHEVRVEKTKEIGSGEGKVDFCLNKGNSREQGISQTVITCT